MLTTAMVEDKSKELEQFKKLLQYFLLHLEYNHHEKLKKDGKISVEFVWPEVDKRIKSNIIDGKKTGQGYNNDKIQDQIKDWCYYPVGKICISVQHSQGGGYTSTGSYLHWPGTGLNINAKWNDEKDSENCKIDYLYYRDIDDGTDIDDKKPEYSISRAGLFASTGNDPQLEKLYDYYISEKKNCLNKKAAFLAKLLEQNHNLILTGAPGTGKTFMAKKIASDMNAECEFVQFHPSYDYTDFVEGLRPKEVNGQIIFERRDGIFKVFCKKAAIAAHEDAQKESRKRKFVFIIDEINRGEISKIFGELFFSIDPGYRGEKDDKGNDNKVNTQYQNLVPLTDEFKWGFYVPENVYVIGTMNDIDRSVESMDFAFRRRFSFVEVTASESESMIYEKVNSVNGWTETRAKNAIQRMQALNSAIVDPQIGGLASQYQIGGAYFLKLGKLGFDFERLWRDNLAGLLYEYYRGQPNVKEILNQLKDRYDLKKNNGKK